MQEFQRQTECHFTEPKMKWITALIEKKAKGAWRFIRQHSAPPPTIFALPCSMICRGWIRQQGGCS
jgi:hypothetical protein